MSIEVNIFKNSSDQDCTNVVRLESVLSGIKNGRWKDIVDQIRSLDGKTPFGKKKIEQLKRYSLPAVIFSGIFDERNDEGCVVYNHLMTIDIDNIEPSRIRTLKKNLSKENYVVTFFNSPSKGDKGLKVVLFIDSEPDKHIWAFLGIEEMFKEKWGIDIDPSGKNISRLCYVSYDPEIYYNPNATPLSPKLINPVEKYGTFYGRKAKLGEGCTDASKIFEHCIKMIKKSKTGGYHVGNRNNFLFALSCLCCEFGIPEEKTFNFIAFRYKSLNLKEINTTIQSAYKRAGKNYGTKVLFEKGKSRSGQSSLINVKDLFNNEKTEE